MFTIQQLIFDVLTWCRYYAANQSVGLQEITILFYEAFQAVYEEAMQSHPEYFEVSAAWSGASITLPTPFRQLDVIVVDDDGCTAGYARQIDNTEWDVRESNTRLQGTATNPHAKIDSTTITINPSMTGGHFYYFRNFSEADFADQTQNLILFLPLIFHPLLLSKMMELVQVRHFQISDDPTVRDRYQAIKNITAKQSKIALKPLEIIEGQSEKPTSIMTPNAQ
jgi:hypothetical protein